MNEFWNVWINSSVEKHFKTNITRIPLFREGEIIDLNKNRAELRIDGPQIEKINSNLYRAYIEVNIIITINMESSYITELDLVNGHVAAAFTDCISCYKIGHPSFDQTLFGHLTEAKGRISRGTYVSNFGQVDPNLRVLQSTVEGHYEMEIKTE